MQVTVAYQCAGALPGAAYHTHMIQRGLDYTQGDRAKAAIYTITEKRASYVGLALAYYRSRSSKAGLWLATNTNATVAALRYTGALYNTAW